jgi:hypothetical protein
MPGKRRLKAGCGQDRLPHNSSIIVDLFAALH